MKGKNRNYLIGAVLLPIIIVWFLVQVQFWLGAAIANGPLAILVAAGVGVFCGSRISFSRLTLKLLFWSLYLIYLAASLFGVGLITSCINGDCI